MRLQQNRLMSASGEEKMSGRLPLVAHSHNVLRRRFRLLLKVLRP